MRADQLAGLLLIICLAGILTVLLVVSHIDQSRFEEACRAVHGVPAPNTPLCLKPDAVINVKGQPR